MWELCKYSPLVTGCDPACLNYANNADTDRKLRLLVDTLSIPEAFHGIPVTSSPGQTFPNSETVLIGYLYPLFILDKLLKGTATAVPLLQQQLIIVTILVQGSCKGYRRSHTGLKSDTFTPLFNLKLKTASLYSLFH